MKKLLLLLLLSAILLLGCTQKTTEISPEEQHSEIQPKNTEQLENAEEKASESQPESSNSREIHSLGDLYNQGKMYHCTLTTNVNASKAVYDVWLYYDASSNTVKYKFKSVINDTEIQESMMELAYSGNQVTTKVYAQPSENTPSFFGDDCDWISIEYVEQVEESGVASKSVEDEIMPENNEFGVEGIDYTKNCVIENYNPSIFEFDGKICSYPEIIY